MKAKSYWHWYNTRLRGRCQGINISDYPADTELALLMVVPHTSAIRGTHWELNIPKTFLKPAEFHLQQIQPIPLVRLELKLGSLSELELRTVKQALIRVLNLQA